MRTEISHGNKIVCEHIFPLTELKIGSKWQSSGGYVTEITDIQGEWIFYSLLSKKTLLSSAAGMNCSF